MTAHCIKIKKTKEILLMIANLGKINAKITIFCYCSLLRGKKVSVFSILRSLFRSSDFSFFFFEPLPSISTAPQNPKKTELIYLVRRFKGIAQARQRIGEFISFYNERRPYMSIGMKTPSQVHAGSPAEKKMWGRRLKV